MQDNPYSALLGTLRTDQAEHSVAPWRLGTVTATEPLAVSLAGQQLSGADLLVNASLLEHSREVGLSDVNGALEGTPQSISITSGALQATAKLSPLLSPGDRVVLLQSGDGQEYILLCKVVSP